MRWSSNFTPEFEKMDATVIYEVTEVGKENVRVRVNIMNEGLEIYLDLDKTANLQFPSSIILLISSCVRTRFQI